MLKKYKCIIWGCGRDYNRYLNAIKLQESIQAIQILGITSSQDYLYKKLDGYEFIKRENIRQGNKLEFDIIVVASINKFSEIRKEILELGINEEKIISIKVFAIPQLNFNKYMVIKNSKLSIFANCCWGGITYNRLGMEFYSPFINMFESAKDYLNILQEPHKYMECPLEFIEYGYDSYLGKHYPICNLNGAILHFNHYLSFEDAVKKWNKRKQRINWENLFIMMYTSNSEEADKFADLPYKNKVCFVPFKTEEESLYYLDYFKMEIENNIDFWRIVNGMAQGFYQGYDVLELLLGNKNSGRLA